jgi:hypothetical protein
LWREVAEVEAEVNCSCCRRKQRRNKHNL